MLPQPNCSHSAASFVVVRTSIHMIISLMWLSPVVAMVVKRGSHEGREKDGIVKKKKYIKSRGNRDGLVKCLGE